MDSKSHIPSNESLEGKCWHAAGEMKLTDVQNLVAQSSIGMGRQFCLDMALMGASNNSDVEERKRIKQWTWLAGACILWDIQQSSPEFVRESKDTNNKLKRLGGPGEVKKGEFKQQ